MKIKCISTYKPQSSNNNSNNKSNNQIAPNESATALLGLCTLFLLPILLPISLPNIALAGPIGERPSNYLRFDGGGIFKEKVSKTFYGDGGKLNSIAPALVEERDKGFQKALSVGIGAYLTPIFRAEIAYTKYDPQKSKATFTYTEYDELKNLVARYKITSQSLLLNAYYDFPHFPTATPYIGAGVGVSRNHSHHVKLGSGMAHASVSGCHSDSIAYMATAGLSFKMGNGWLMDVGYRYTNLGTVKTGNALHIDAMVEPFAAEKGRITNHTVMAGVRFSF